MEEVMEMDPIEAEVHAIRQKLWQRTKDMTPDEFREYIIRKTDPIIKQFHMKMSKLKPIEPFSRWQDDDDD